ncbi:MAG: DUF5312 domain-containing protein [Treponema sp.]|jgi:hypothetical protein|nr:DUF5312 domain-containing protein [Treponema sp.]
MAAVFLQKIVSLFSGDNDPSSARNKLLRTVIKELSQNKYSKFYRIKTEEAEPVLGKFFYDIYKTIAPAQVFMRNAAKSAQLKQIIIEAFMDKRIQGILKRISPEAIEERVKKTPPREVALQVKGDIAVLAGSFDGAKTDTVDSCYILILSFARFVSFNYLFLLQKFDPRITEGNFNYQPKFEHIKAEGIANEIKDFLEAAQNINSDQDWKNALRVLKIYKGDMDVVAVDQWNRILLLLRDVRRSNILELIMRHIQKNPNWVPKPQLQDEHIVDSYLEEKRSEALNCINTIVNAKRNAQVKAISKTIFGGANVSRLRYYTEKDSDQYTRKNFDGFLYAGALNYLKAFYMDFSKKDIKELCDLLLIRGQWTSNVLSQQMSEGYHNFMELSDRINALDETLADNGEHGSRLKNAMLKAEHNKGSAKYVRVILNTLNDEAKTIINAAAQALILIGKNLKGVIDDYHKSPHDLIINWKELESAAEDPLIQRITLNYKRIYFLVQILQLLMQDSGQEEG